MTMIKSKLSVGFVFLANLLVLRPGLGAEPMKALDWQDPAMQKVGEIASYTGCEAIRFWTPRQTAEPKIIAWAGAILDFTFGGPHEFRLHNISVDSGTKSSSPITYLELRERLTKEAGFTEWVGEKWLAQIDAFAKVREKIESPAEKTRFKSMKVDTKTMNLQQLNNDPLVKAYFSQQEKLLKTLESKIPLTRQDVSDDCN